MVKVRRDGFRAEVGSERGSATIQGSSRTRRCWEISVHSQRGGTRRLRTWSLGRHYKLRHGVSRNEIAECRNSPRTLVPQRCVLQEPVEFLTKVSEMGIEADRNNSGISSSSIAMDTELKRATDGPPDNIGRAALDRSLFCCGEIGQYELIILTSDKVSGNFSNGLTSRDALHGVQALFCDLSCGFDF